MFDVLAIGNALVDHEYAVSEEQLKKTNLTKGSMSLADEQTQQATFASFKRANINTIKQTGGGSAANAMFAFASLGGKPFYACRVGNDASGKFYLKNLAQAGVKTNEEHAISQTGTTGSCIVAITPDGERSMQTFLGTSSDIGEDNIDFSALKQSDWLYLEGYLAMSESFMPVITKLRQQAGINNCKIAISFADPAVVNFAKDGLLKMLGNGVDIIFCNSEEARQFTGKKHIKSAAKALTEFCHLAVVTDGAKDTLICERDDNDETTIILVSTPHVADVIDTNGAGDNYSGSFLYALSQHYSLIECGELATAVSSKVVRQLGPRLTPAEYKDIAKRVLVV